MNKEISGNAGVSKAGHEVRAAARELLIAVLDKGRPLDEAAAQQMAIPPLAGADSRDRAFFKLLAVTTLRRLGQIDAALAGLIDKPLGPEARYERAALRLGAAQLLFLGTPAHAAVNGAVASLSRKSPYRGLINAVLRRLAREAQAILAGQDAARCNTPDWLWQGWVDAYDEATARAIALAHLVEPPLDLSVKADAAGWAARLNGRLLATGSVRITASGPVEQLPGYGEGAWWVQDAAAALPVRLLGPRPGERVLDLCAAPGGKTLELALAGARVTALDRSARRLERVTENLQRTGLSAELVTADAALWRPPEPADAVLLDAPCSATGTLRRHPDVAWIKRPEDIAKLVAAQARLLDAAAAMVRPGGRLIYCVCSLEPAEGAQQIEQFLQRPAAGGFRRLAVQAEELPGLGDAGITPAGDLRTLPSLWPELGGMDGFYVARLQRTA